jgi:hypothetical protein
MRLLGKLFKFILTIILVFCTGGLWLIVMFIGWIFRKKKPVSYSDFYTYIVTIMSQ